jgi:hypothetical protein
MVIWFLDSIHRPVFKRLKAIESRNQITMFNIHHRQNPFKLIKSSCYLCVCLYPPLLTSECMNHSLWNLVYHSTWAHLNSILHKSLHQSVSLLSKGLVNPFPQQQIHATTEVLLDVSFSIWSVSYQRKSGNQFFPELLVKRLNLGAILIEIKPYTKFIKKRERLSFMQNYS